MGSTEKAEELHDRLIQLVKELTTTEDWLRSLEITRRLHRYSWRNAVLIWEQARRQGFEASMVAGYRRWQELGRQVRKGEKGLAILAPITRKDEDDEVVLVGFRGTTVFDVSQTDGEALPDRPEPVLLDGGKGQWDALAGRVAEEGYEVLLVTPAAMAGPGNGVTIPSKRQVQVRDDLGEAQRTKTLAHELAHVLLHAEDPTFVNHGTTRSVAEVEAESVAYLVCGHLGIDSATYSIPYVAGWSGGDVDLITNTAERVTHTASGIIESLENTAQSAARGP